MPGHWLDGELTAIAAAGIWPGNSLLGFRCAREMAVDAVGFDVHLTKAGELLVIHDLALKRQNLATGKVAERSPTGRK